MQQAYSFDNCNIGHFLIIQSGAENNKTVSSLPADVVHLIANYLPVIDHMRFRSVNKFLYTLMPCQPYWAAALQSRFPCSSHKAPSSFEKYKHCQQVYNNMVNGNWEMTTFPCLIPGDSATWLDGPLSVNIGQEYIAVLSCRGFVEWFSSTTREKLGELQSLEPDHSSYLSCQISEYKGLLYITVESTPNLLKVICPTSQKILFTDTYEHRRVMSSSFKIVDDILYLHDSAKTIRIYDTKNMNSYEILTDFFEDDTYQIEAFDIDPHNDHLCISSVKGDVGLLAIFDLNNKEKMNCDLKEGQGDSAVVPRNYIKIPKIYETEFEKEMAGFHRICGKSLYSARAERDMKELEFDFENHTTREICFPGSGVQVISMSQLCDDYLYIPTSHDKIDIWNIHTRKHIQRLDNDLRSFMQLSHVPSLCMCPGKDCLVFVDIVRGINIGDGFHTSSLSLTAKFEIKVINFDVPPKPRLIDQCQEALQRGVEACKKKVNHCETQ